ncbi:hypothetical protein AS026_13510 [Rhizobium altiplani]|uniref:Uncharacterized protein n=1 Tax=Rhizobium altiplani TaxID=1864509 RepID=A0A109JE59_9HYPH|nr:hypothetical protein AS026_13510 [Rhizobium altiplani]
MGMAFSSLRKRANRITASAQGGDEMGKRCYRLGADAGPRGGLQLIRRTAVMQQYHCPRPYTFEYRSDDGVDSWAIPVSRVNGPVDRDQAGALARLEDFLSPYPIWRTHVTEAGLGTDRRDCATSREDFIFQFGHTAL